MSGAGPACSLPDRQLGSQQKSRPEPGSLPGRGKQPLPFARRVREDCRGRAAPRKGWGPFAAEMLSLVPSCLAFGHLGSGRYDVPLSLASRGFPEVRGLFSEYLYCSKLRRCPRWDYRASLFPGLPPLCPNTGITWAIPESHPQRF